MIGVLRDVYRAHNSLNPNLARLVRRVHVVWVVQQFAQMSWFVEELLAILKKAIAPLPTLHIHIYATKGGSSANPYAKHARSDKHAEVLFVPGRPNLRGEFAAACSGLKPETERLFTFVCGPSQLVHEVWDLATELRGRNFNVGFHRETFEL